MSSAWRNAALASALIAASGVLGAVGSEARRSSKSEVGAEAAQERMRGFGRGRDLTEMAPIIDYDGRFAFTRLRYGRPSGGFSIREPWAHDYPRAEFNFLKILSELTYVRSFIDAGNIRTLADPDLALFPIAYMSEPGFWTMGEEEMAGLRGYLQKGGFIIFDDFRDNHRDNLIAQMQRVLPGAAWRPLDATHPIFHSFFEINSLDVEGYYGQVEWTGIFEDNDPAKRLMAVANYNQDLGELWEFSDTGMMPIDLSNEAYKFGVNYVVYAMTH